MSVIVIGSLIIDNTIYVQKLPERGETTFAKSSLISYGGKGANQALAAHLAGGKVNLIGCVGSDSEGDRYKRHLEQMGIDSSFVTTSQNHETGSAFITVEDSGENSIVVNLGANQNLKRNHIEKTIDLIKTSEIMLLQQEVPKETVQYACEVGKKYGLKIIMNPSPLSPYFDVNNFPSDILILNEVEAEQLSGEKNPLKSMEMFDKFELESVIITQGDGPIIFRNSLEPIRQFQPPKVQPIDTVGAGDTFAGTFATALSTKKSITDSIRYAGIAASISVTKPGAQGAMPTKKEIESFVI